MKCAEKYAPRGLSSDRNFESVLLQPSSMVVRVKMDFRHRYYKLNKALLTYVGLWPYQTPRARRIILGTELVISIGQLASTAMASVKYRADTKILMEGASIVIFGFACVMKVVCCIWNSQKMLKLLNLIRANWQTWAQDEEINILHRYADQGRKMSIAYAVVNYSNGVLFMMQPVVPKIIDVLLKNGTEPGEFPFPVYCYHLEPQKYYFHIIAYTYVAGGVAMIVTVANDTMFIVYMQHGIGIFAALGHKLQRIGKNKITAETREKACALNERDVDYEYLVSCIGRHNDAIEYAKLMEATYTWYFFSIVGLNMLIISVTGVQIIKKTNDLHETIKFIVWLIAGLVHLYIMSYMSQILADHSINIRYYMHNGKWYCLSMKAQKIFPIMLMRCNVPCALTAGKFAVMSVPTFRAFLNTSASYFTLLRSM